MPRSNVHMEMRDRVSGNLRGMSWSGAFTRLRPRFLRVEYDCRAWRSPSFSLLLVANAGIQSGESLPSPALPRPLNLKCRLESWDSRNRRMPLQPSCESGVSTTGIGATFPNGFLLSGESLLIRCHHEARRDGRNNNNQHRPNHSRPMGVLR